MPDLSPGPLPLTELRAQPPWPSLLLPDPLNQNLHFAFPREGAGRALRGCLLEGPACPPPPRLTCGSCHSPASQRHTPAAATCRPRPPRPAMMTFSSPEPEVTVLVAHESHAGPRSAQTTNETLTPHEGAAPGPSHLRPLAPLSPGLCIRRPLCVPAPRIAVEEEEPAVGRPGAWSPSLPPGLLPGLQGRGAVPGAGQAGAEGRSSGCPTAAFMFTSKFHFIPKFSFRI